MNEEEINILAQKIKEGTSTSEEELKLLKFLNQGIDQVRTFVKEVIKTKEIDKIRSDIKE